MKITRFTTKAILAFLVAVIVLGTVSIFAVAGDTITNKNLAYGEIVPTDAALKAQKFTYNFYGDKGDMYFMRLSKGVPNAYFSIEIYSDKYYKEQIRSFSKEYDLTQGNKSLKVTWEFKKKPSGTYYGRCYSYTLDKEGNKIIDSASMKTFKINVDRISKKTVALKSLVNTTQGPKITWTKFPTATQYNVYRRASGETKWTFLKSVKSSASSYTDTTAKSGKTYSYTVKCRDEKYVSLYNKTGLSTLYLATPVISVNGTGTAGTAKVQWKAIDGASGYRVYRKGGSLSDYSWKLIATIKNGKTTSYVDKTATSTDWNYTYTVRAFNDKSSSAYNNNGVNFDYIPAPSLSKTTSVDGGVKITWKANNPNITGYKVFRKDGTSWKYVGSSKTKSFIDKTAVSGKTYTYTVKAQSDTNVGAYNAKGITQKYLKTPELQPLKFDSNYRSLVKWETVGGATGYKVYRKINNAKTWTLVTTIKNGKTASYYDDCKKSSGKTYTYTVRAFDGSKNLSSYKTAGTTAMCLAKPKFTSQQVPTQAGSLCIETTWSAVNGATAYNVYRRLPDGKWSVLTTGIPDLSYVDTTVECGITYEYAVRAINDNGDISPYNTKSATAVLIPVLDSVVVAEEGVKLNWNALDNANSYNVYRQAKGSDTWERIASVETNEYTDISEEGKTQPYYYTVSAVFGEIESKTYAGMPNFLEIAITAETVYPTEENTAHIKVSFDCPDAEIIEVYKSVNNEEAVLLEYTDDFVDAEITEGNTYTYTVVAIAAGKVNGSESASAKYNHPPLDPATITSCIGDYNNGEPTITITWNEVEFADEYVILRVADNGEWVEIGGVATDSQESLVTFETDSEEPETKTFSFTDTNVSAEISYSYKVKAVATKSERESSESSISQIKIYTPLDSVTGIKILPEKNADGTVSITISWDETAFAEYYTIYRKTSDSEWKEIAVDSSGEDGWSCADTVSINTNYTYKISASAANRGTVSNEQTFCWSETITPESPENETLLNVISDTTYISGKYIVTDLSDNGEIEAIVTAKEGYTLQVTKSHDENCGTGSVIGVYKDSEPATAYTLIVKGDVNGDGICDALDCAIIEKLATGNEIAIETYIFAADLNNDGAITLADYETSISMV